MTQDSFPPVKRLRELVVGAAGRGSSLAELVECAWCAGWWVTVGCRVARRVAPRWWGPFAEAMAVAMVASYFVGKSTEEGDPKDVAEAIEDAKGPVAPWKLSYPRPTIRGEEPNRRVLVRNKAGKVVLAFAPEDPAYELRPGEEWEPAAGPGVRQPLETETGRPPRVNIEETKGES